jgi:hypothetical protein
MTTATYVAKRSIISGHLLGESYTIALKLLSTSPGFEREVNATENESLSGHVETLRFHAAKTIQVDLAPLKGGTELDAVLEFLDSVEGGESFTFDHYGSIAVPHDPVSARRQKGSYSLARHTPIGAGGATDYFSISFRVRVLIP